MAFGVAFKLAVVARRDLGMSPGKLAAQVGHAVHEAVGGRRAKRRLAAWEADGARIVVLQATGEQELRDLEHAAQASGLASSSVYDAGLTEVDDGTWTVLAVGPDASARVDSVTGRLSSWREEPSSADLREQLRQAESGAEALRRRNGELERLLARATGRDPGPEGCSGDLQSSCGG